MMFALYKTYKATYFIFLGLRDRRPEIFAKWKKNKNKIFNFYFYRRREKKSEKYDIFCGRNVAYRMKLSTNVDNMAAPVSDSVYFQTKFTGAVASKTFMRASMNEDVETAVSRILPREDLMVCEIDENCKLNR